MMRLVACMAIRAIVLLGGAQALASSIAVHATGTPCQLAPVALAAPLLLALQALPARLAHAPGRSTDSGLGARDE